MDIEELIEKAEAKSDRSRNAMNGADTSANLAYTVALQAQSIADEASSKAGVIRKASTSTLDEAIALSNSAKSLSVKLDETKTIIFKKEKEARRNGNATHNALSKAEQAQNKAKEATQRVQQAKKELEQIAAILSNVKEPEPGLLEDLARRVEDAERQFKAQDLEQTLNDLQRAKQRQVEQVRDMEKELEYLRDETKNVQTIKGSLPDFCPKSNNLCLEDQC